ncbi:MAG: hypothetical protein ACJ736_23760 [Streptomyces sp.]
MSAISQCVDVGRPTTRVSVDQRGTGKASSGWDEAVRKWAFLVVGRHLGLRHRLGGGRA